MSLSPGTLLGPYEIVAPIGAGGMGDVYKARDTRLDRTVAIKVSRDAFTDRFEREARAVASLNHPHICALHDVGPNYLVMEYVEGTALAGPLPLERALACATQICDALDAAHRRGIAHRDLKPANILVSKAGVKLLDFGLAKIDPAVVATEATMTRALTQQGQILGTLHYMSPEQLQGQEAGPASDIFSFGLVLYEMLTGKRAFDGSSPASVIAAILERPAPSIADIAPPALDRVMKRCLEKDPDRRWQSARDLRAELEWIASGGASEVHAAAVPRSQLAWIPWALAAALALAAAAALWAPWREAPSSAATFTFAVESPEGIRYPGGPMISPDGTRLATIAIDIRGNRALEIRHLDSLASRRLPAAPPSYIAWSKDGRYLAFVDGLRLRKIDVSGGEPTTIGDFPPGNGPPFISWSSEGVILFSGRDGLYKISASGGVPQKVTARTDARGHTGPQFLPDSRRFLYWHSASTVEDGTVYAGSIDAPPDQNAIEVLKGTSAAVFARDARGREYLLFGRGGALQAQPFDSRRLKMTGEPFVVASQIGMMGPVPAVSVSDNGVLSYATDISFSSTQVQLTWFDRQGTRLGTAGPPGAYPEFSLSPDEAHIAASRIGGDGSQDIVVIDRTQGGPATRFTFDPAPERSPVWSPDSTRIVFIRLNGGLFVKPFVGTGPEQQVIDRAGFPTDWSQDTIVYSADADVMFLSGGKASRFRETALEEYDARLSPDGAWIAYASGDSRPGSDVFVERVPASGFIRQISDGGVQPLWSADGRELFYIRPPRQLTARGNTTGPADDGAVLMAVRLQLGDTPTFSAPIELFPIHPSAVSRGFGAARNGQRFLLPVSTTEGRPSPITISTNWAAD